MAQASDIEFHATFQTDGELLADLRVDVMRESLEAVGRFDPDRARARFLNSFDPKTTTKIFIEDELTGFFVVKICPDHILLDHLYIALRQQGGGIGSKVMEKVKSLADDASLPIKLCALKNSPSNAFYLRHGFKLTHSDELDCYYQFFDEF